MHRALLPWVSVQAAHAQRMSRSAAWGAAGPRLGLCWPGTGKEPRGLVTRTQGAVGSPSPRLPAVVFLCFITLSWC